MQRERRMTLALAVEAMCRQIDPDNGLLQMLLSEGVLGPEQIESCRREPTRACRVQKLVHCLMLEDDSAYEKFRDVFLKMGEQQFVNKHIPPIEVRADAFGNKSIASGFEDENFPTSLRQDAYFLSQLPLELVEMFLMKAFVAMFKSQMARNLRPYVSVKRPYATLSSVCSYWWFTLNGWPDSNTKQWVRHRLLHGIRQHIQPIFMSRLKDSLPSTLWKTESAGNFSARCREIIEIDYELLSHLEQTQLISAYQKEIIQEKETVYERIDKLIDFMSASRPRLNSDQCEHFFNALRLTNQQHVLNAITWLSDYYDHKLVFGDALPLSSDQQSLIDINISSLVDLIDPNNELLELLHAAGCITSQQKQCIADDQTTADKNRRLLNILRRRSVRDYKLFVECLKKTKQHWLTARNAIRGVVLSYDVNVSNSSLVREIVNQFQSTYNTEGLQILSCGTEQLGSDVTLIDMIERNDATMYFLCKSVNGFHHIDELFHSGQLKTRLQQTYVELVHGYDDICITKLACDPYNFIHRQLHFYPEARWLWIFRDPIRRCPCFSGPDYDVVDELLARIIEPDYGLLDELASAELLNPEQLDAIRSEKTLEERNSRIMRELRWVRFRFMDRRSRTWPLPSEQILVCLRNTHQQHVVNLCCRASGLGQRWKVDRAEKSHTSHDTCRQTDVYHTLQDINNYDDVFGNIWSMTSDQLQFIAFNNRVLTEMFNPNSGLLCKLYLSSCITLQQKQAIESRTSASERNQLLFDILTRRSIRDFLAFREHLQITEEGVFLPVNITIESGDFDADLSPIFREIAKEFEIHQRADSSGVLSELRRQLGADVSLVKLQEHMGIRAYFYCKNVMGLHRFDELCITKQLNATLQQLFDDLFPNNGIFSISDVVCKATEYTRCVRYFHMKMGLLKTIYELIPQGEHEETGSFNMGSWKKVRRPPLNADMTKSNESERILPYVMVKSAGLLLRVFNKLTAGRSDIITWTILGAVCRSWLHIIRTHVMKSRMDRCFDYVSRPYRHAPLLVKEMDTKRSVLGAAMLDDKIFAVCSGSDNIEVFGSNYERLDSIEVKGLKHPNDIVSCSETRSLYVADCGWRSQGCVWQLTLDEKVNTLLDATTFPINSLSVARRRLLVTTTDDRLLLYGLEEAIQLNSLSLPGMSLQHAVETSRGTFVVCHQKPEPQVSEIDGYGRVIRVYNDQQQLTKSHYISFDSEGKFFVADCSKHRILLLTSDLQLDKILLDNEHSQLARGPNQLCYIQQTSQLIVCSFDGRLQVFAVGSAAHK